MRKLVAILAAIVATAAANAGPITLSQGGLTTTIRDTPNGATNNTAFNGTEFYRSGAFVSDFGFQVGANTGTFRLNTTTGGTGTNVTLTGGPGTAIVTGTYNGVDFTRTTSLVSGLDVVRTAMSFTNTTGSAITLRFFDTFDPDQGTGLGTGPDSINDVYNLSGFNVARATDNNALGMTVIYGSPVAGTILGFGGGSSPFGLGIGGGSALNTFFGTPFDPNGGLSDIGVGVGYEITLGAGSTFNYQFDQAFGTTRAAAEDQFLRAQAVPEPISMIVFGSLVVGGIVAVRRRMTKAAA